MKGKDVGSWFEFGDGYDSDLFFLLKYSKKMD